MGKGIDGFYLTNKLNINKYKRLYFQRGRMKKNGIRRVTMSDVARRSGVDLSTVSRVLNRSFENHKYAPETVERVQNTAEELGFQPSLAARALRTGKTMLLGVVVSDIGNSFFGEIASSLDACISGHGYRLLISNTSEDPARQAGHIEGMLAHGVDGLIVSPSGEDGLDRAVEEGVPVVTIDRPLPGSSFPFVGLDNMAATRLLAANLKTRGYRRVGVVVPESQTDPTLLERLAGLRSGLEAEGCTLSWTVQIPPANDLQKEARRAVSEKFRDEEGLPDAVVGLSNVCTMGLLEALADCGLAWGASLGLAGIDDFSAASLVRPSITVVRQPIQRIAAEAFSLLLNQMENPKEEWRNPHIQLEPVWEERESLPQRKP